MVHTLQEPAWQKETTLIMAAKAELNQLLAKTTGQSPEAFTDFKRKVLKALSPLDKNDFSTSFFDSIEYGSEPIKLVVGFCEKYGNA